MKRRYTITIRDENGDVYVEGDVHSLNLSAKYGVPGIEFDVRGFATFKRDNSHTDDSGLSLDYETKKALSQVGDTGVTAAKCAHSWKSYQGLMEKYDYCSTCGVKK